MAAKKNGTNVNDESNTTKEEESMPAAKSNAKKSAAKKPATAKRKTAGKGTARKTRKPRVPAGPMPQSVKSAAATALAAIEEKLYDAEDLGVTGTTSRELKGARSGLMKRVKTDDGHTITITVAYR